jgi:protein TonB
MRDIYLQSDRRDRAKSAAATLAIHLVLAAAFLAGLAIQTKRASDDGLKTFDVREAPPPPPIPTELSKPAERRPAPEGVKSDPSPIVAPPARLPTPQPIAAATVSGSGASTTTGAGSSGTGTGAGGSGGGRGGNFGIGVEARLLSGNRSRLSRQLLRSLAADRGYAHLLLTVAEDGRVTNCSVMQGTGSVAVDGALCQVMIGQSRWSPAHDTSGRPIAVQVRYTATWSKD